MTVASFHLATFPLRRSISRFLVVPAERWEVTAAPGCILGKVMGTSKPGTTKTSIDIRRWAMFAVWETEQDRDHFVKQSSLMERWRSNADELVGYALDPIGSHGSWDGIVPFDGAGPPSDATQTKSNAEPVAVLTRAAVRWSRIWRFTRSIGPVDDELFKRSDCSLALGMGEWPIGEQATFSIWDSSNALRAFAYDNAAHKEVIKRRANERWYKEEMFSRFRIAAL